MAQSRQKKVRRAGGNTAPRRAASAKAARLKATGARATGAKAKPSKARRASAARSAGARVRAAAASFRPSGPPVPRYQDLKRPDETGLPLAWGLWAPGDQLGTLNNITPEGVTWAAAEIQRGVRFNLDLPLRPVRSM